MFNLNLNKPKTNWDGAEEPTINNLYEIDHREFWICSLKCGSAEAIWSTCISSTEVDRNTSILGDS